MCDKSLYSVCSFKYSVTFPFSLRYLRSAPNSYSGCNKFAVITPLMR